MQVALGNTSFHSLKGRFVVRMTDLRSYRRYKRMIPGRGVYSGSAARMSRSTPSARFRAKNWLEALSTTARRTCPVNAESKPSRTDFQIHSEVVQNVAGS